MLEKEQKFIVKSLSTGKTKSTRKALQARTEQDVLNGIKQGVDEVKEAKRTVTLDAFLNQP